MDTGSPPSLAEQIAAAQAWWREAGVDCDFSDDPIQWLRSEEEAESHPPLSAPPQPEIDRSSWPTSLAEFPRWWLAEPTLDQGGLFPRIAPRGEASAKLMIVVAEPEESDTDRLLSGRQGALLDAMLAAMGLAEGDIYLAAALPRHTPMADWTALGRSGTGELLRHHIGLASPKRVLILGQQLPPLLGHDPAQGAASFSEIAFGGAKFPVLVMRDLASLLNRARWRAEFWRRWLDWTDGVGS
jgi:uracil-DNA glycosylase